MRHQLLFGTTRGYQVDLNPGGGSFSATTYDTLGIAGTLLSGASGTITIPAGATQIVVEIWGGGGGGSGGQYDTNDYGGGGGGSGGYAKITRALSSDSGKSVSWARGAAGTVGVNAVAPTNATPGGNGGQSTSSGATLTNSFSITAGGGSGGFVDTTAPFDNNGSGGTTSGGDSGSSVGVAGTDGVVDTNGVGGAAIVGISSRSAGAGGDGGLELGAVSPVAGGIGRVIIYLT
jgi:hypothetical protein